MESGDEIKAVVVNGLDIEVQTELPVFFHRLPIINHINAIAFPKKSLNDGFTGGKVKYLRFVYEGCRKIEDVVNRFDARG
jgi:hypothetical protein